MKQIDWVHYRKLIIIALVVLGCSFSLSALSFDNARLIALSLEEATEGELQAMVKVRNLPLGSPKEMRSSLYAYHGIQGFSLEEEPTAKQTYILTIVHADQVSSDRSRSSLVTLQGDAVVQFSLKDEEQTKLLSAQRMVVDLENSLLIAFGDVIFDEGEKMDSLQRVTGDIVSLNWNSKALLVTGGTTTTERKNSEDEDVSFFTTGDTISYNGSGDGILFDRGFITTNKKHAYSSITAESLAFLSGGDLLVKNAYLSIGRVPVLWVPAFFIPGVRMVGNPAIGFSSDRGEFLNTTFEIYGTYPNFKKAESSSFTTLLTGEPDASFVPVGGVYRAREGQMTPFERWTTDSGSYLTLMADSYASSGITLGLEAHHAFFSKKVVLDTTINLAVHPGGKDLLHVDSDFPKIRFFGSNKFVIDSSWADLTITTPFYSDPTVKRLYGNRLSSFSFDALFGKKQEFPSDYTGDIRSFTWKADGSFTFPTQKAKPYITQARIRTLNASIDWKWSKKDTLYSYRVQKLTLPELQASISGTLFSWSRPLERRAKTVQDEKRSEPAPPPFTLDPLLEKAYVPPPASSPKATLLSQEQSITLGYSVEEKILFSVANLDLPNTDWDTNRNLYTSTNPSLELDMVLHPTLFTFKQKLASAYITSEDRTKTTYLTRQFQLTSVTTAQVPLIGFRYDLEGKLYTFRDSYSTLTTTPTEQSFFTFTKEHVTKHQAKFAKSFSVGEGTLSPSITATLFPLTQSLLPSLSYAIGPWTLNASLKFVDRQGELIPTLLSSSVSYKNPFTTLMLGGTYDLENQGSRRLDPLSLTGSALVHLFDKQLSFKESFTFIASSPVYGQNYFKDLRTTISLPFITSTIVYAGPSSALRAESLTTQVAVTDFTTSWWKRRIQLRLALDAKLSISFVDTYATFLSVTAKADFSIAEFLDFSFSVTTTNRGFHRYYDTSTFSFPLMWEDLLRSFDLVGGGRSATQFNMNSVTMELIHYMEDWSLNCTYTGNVVLSGYQYRWVPVVQVFLQWKTIPELKVDEKWTESAQGWIPSPSS